MHAYESIELGGHATAKGEVHMSAMDIVRQGFAAVEAGDFDTMERLASDDFVFEGPVPQPVGKAEWIGLQQALVDAIPDWTFHPSSWREEGDVVYVNLAITGTHRGTLNLPFLPAPVAPTGKTISLPADPAEFTVRDGQITHIMVHSGPDSGVMGILQQIGVPLPPM